MKNIMYGQGAFLRKNSYWLNRIFGIDYICDSNMEESIISGKPFISSDKLSNSEYSVFVTVENPDIKSEIVENLKTKNINLASFVKDTRNNEKGLWLWGTLEECRIYDWFISAQNSEYFVSGYVTNQPWEIGTDSVNGRPIISLQRAIKKLDDCQGIVAFTDCYPFDYVTRRTVNEEVLAKRNYYVAPFRYLEKLKSENKEFNTTDILIPYGNVVRTEILQFMITAHCNLNCKLCTHLAGLVPKDEIYSFDEFEHDIEWAASQFDSIDSIGLWGGRSISCT